LTTVVIQQPMLFPWVGMIEHIAMADVYIHRDDVPFSKSWRTHRIQIKTAKGAEWMTIPIAHHCFEQPIVKLEASSQDWRTKHVRVLENAYAKAPYKREMLQIVRDVYEREDKPLVETISASVETLIDYFGLRDQLTVMKATEMQFAGDRSQQLVEMVQAVNGDVYLTGHGARNYIDHELFESNGIDVRYVEYSLSEYPQLHGNFEPYISALDLIANTGPDARNHHLKPRAIPWREFAGDEDS